MPTAGSGGVTRRLAARVIDEAKGLAAASPCNTPFGDVPCTDPDWGWVQTLVTQGISAGCGGTNFCPDNAVTKQTAAALLMKGKWGSSYNPTCTTGYFTDFACPASNFAEAAVKQGVIPVCVSSPRQFCPTAGVNELNMQTYMAAIWTTYRAIPASTTYTVRDPQNRVLTEFVDGFAVRDNIWLGNLLVASYRPAKGGSPSEWQFHSHDHLGSVRFTLFPGSGLTESRKFWPYGERADPLGFPTQRIMFAGTEGDVEASGNSKHYYDHARFEDFNLARFASPDPVNVQESAELERFVLNPQRWNAYSYAIGNPIRNTDPDGKTDKDELKLIWNAAKHWIKNHIRKDIELGESKFRTNDPRRAAKLIERAVLSFSD